MATALSLEEVLSQYGLKRKDLEAVCPRDVRNKVAVELIDWKMVGHCFDFSRAKLEAIDRENQTEDQRKVALLDAWGESEGKGATYFKLAEILHRRGRRDLVQMLCDELQFIALKSKELSKDIGKSLAEAQVIDTAEVMRRGDLEKIVYDAVRKVLTTEGTSLLSSTNRLVSTPSTNMDYPPGGGGGVYAPGPVQTQQPQFRSDAMDTSAPPTGTTAPKYSPSVTQGASKYPLPLCQRSGDVKPFGFDFNVFEHGKPDDPVSSPPSMQEIQQQRLLEDLAMKQGELKRKEEEIERLRIALKRKEEEIERLRIALKEGNSNKLGEAEQYKKNIRDLESMLRTKNEEVNGLFCELQLYHQQMENIQAAKPFDEKEFYRMDKIPHGMCVIINNHQFHHPTDPDKAHLNRAGAEVDQKNLKLTFEYLRYIVEIHENLTHDQMTDLMLRMAQRNHANYDSFICCILTHGEENKVHGADSIPVSLLDMMGVMKMCKTLVNKPKMFFIQADRGDQEDKGHQLGEDMIQQDGGGKLQPSMHTIPQEADFFFSYATPLGNAAYRSRHHGSWYTSELCKVLTRHAYTSNLSTMMRKVNNNMCQAFTKEGYKQTAEFVDRLRTGVHFFHFSKVQQQQQQLPQHTQPPAH